MEKLPNAPIWGKPADCGTLDHGEEGPFIPAVNGPVFVRLNEPNGESSGASCLVSLINDGPNEPSLKSVLLLSKDGGGVETWESSRLLLRFAIGEDMALVGGSESLVSRRRIPGRGLGTCDPGVGFPIVCEMDPFRPLIPTTGAPSLIVCAGAFNGEFTELVKIYYLLAHITSKVYNIS